MEFETIAAIIAEQFSVDADTITEETDILEDLNASSMDAVDLIVAIESATDVEIPDDVVDEIRTVADILAYLREHMPAEDEK